VPHLRAMEDAAAEAVHVSSPDLNRVDEKDRGEKILEEKDAESGGKSSDLPPSPSKDTGGQHSKGQLESSPSGK